MIVDRACVFRLGESLFAFPGHYVQEVTKIEKLSPVPRTTPVLLGLIASRGSIYPLLDLGFKIKQDNELLNSDDSLSGAANETSPKKSNIESRIQTKHALIVQDGEGEVALAVDEVVGYESQVPTDDADMQLEIAAALGFEETSKNLEGYPSYYQGDAFDFSGQEVMMLNLIPLLDDMSIEVV